MAEPADPRVPALAPDGTPITIRQSSAAQLKAAGGRLLYGPEAAGIQRTEELKGQFEGPDASGLEGAIMPPLLGAARGLTLGLSDQAITRGAEMLGGESARAAAARRLEDYQDYAPVASTVGEIGAIAGAGLAGDEGGWANLPAAIGRVGRGAEAGLAGAFGDASALARVGSRAIAGAASGATEGAIYSAGKTVSDGAIHNEPLTAEKLVAGASHGLLVGAGLGGGLGLLGGLGGEAVSGLRGRAADGSIAIPNRPGATEELAGSAPMEAVASAAPKGTIADQLDKAAHVKTIKALSGSAADIRALEANVPGGYQRVAGDILNDIESSTGKSIGAHSKESIHDYTVARKEELGKKLGGMLEHLDESGSGVAPSPKAFVAKAREELVAPNLIARSGGEAANPLGLGTIGADLTPKMANVAANDVGRLSVLPGQEKSVAAVEGWINRIENAFSDRAPTFKEWQKIRVGLDKELKFESAQVSPQVETLRKLRGIMEGELESAGDKAAATMGGKFSEEYQATKALYQSVSKAEELSMRGVSRELVNNSLGLRASLGLIGGVATGSPLAGVLMGAAGKVIKDRGDQMAADLLHRASTIQGVTGLANRVTTQMQSGVRSLIPQRTGANVLEMLPKGRTGVTPLGVRLTSDRRSDYAKVSSAVSTAVSNPGATSDRVARAIGDDVAHHTPGVAQHAIQTTMAGVNFLASKLPPTHQDPYSIQPQFQKPRASDAEISQFMRYAQAVDDPLIVLREAKTNTLSRDHVEAVKAVYPNIYAELQQTTLQALVGSKSQLPYGKRIQLGILLDIPTDNTLSPEFLRAIQATYSDAEKAGAESPPHLGAAPKVAQSEMTATQRAIDKTI